MGVLEYVDKNKEWLFSGIGVATLALVISHFWHRFFPKSHQERGAVVIVQTGQDLAQIGTIRQKEEPAQITKVTSISFSEISEALEKLPPLQQEDAAKRYEGIVVQWDTYLFNATMEKGDMVRLALDFGPANTRMVYCKVRLSEYRELGVLPMGAPITVMGRIKEVGKKTATLEEVQLFFHASPITKDRA